MPVFIFQDEEVGLVKTVLLDKKKSNRHSNWKGVELHLFMDNMMLHIENSKESTWKLLGLVNKFSKAAG